MQAARKAVGTALALVKLATGMQAGEHQLDHRCFFFRMHAKRNAPAIVIHADRPIHMQGHPEFFTVPGECLICRVIEHFLNDMQRVVCTGVHAGPLFDRLQPLEYADGAL